ncbi:hypothetical protein H4R35_005574 [Dimargaris xerosporica]|nr:hypothetical protein H4R35_005574 [Dimargaris xerosporica]
MSHLRATFEERASDSPESSFVRAPAVQGRLQSRLHDAGYFSVSSDATPKGALDDVYAVALVSNSKQSQILEVLTMASPLLRLSSHKLVDPTDPEADRRETEEPKSFVAKYWYILLPLALMTLINSFGPEEKDATGSDGSESATKATKKREGKASSSKRA